MSEQNKKTYNHGIKKFITLLIVSTFMVGCASLVTNFTQYGKDTKKAVSAYNNSNYALSVKLSTKALKIKPEYADAQAILVKSLPLFIRYSEERISSLDSKIDLNSVDLRVQEYKTLISITNGVRDLPLLTDKESGKKISLPVNDYSKKLMSAKKDAAEAFYSEANKKGEVGGIDNSKSAAKLIRRAQSYIPEYKNTNELYEKYRAAGIKRMAIFSFENKSGHTQFGNMGEMVSDQITSQIMGNSAAIEFLTLTSKSELEEITHSNNIDLGGGIKTYQAIEIGKKLGLHEIIIGNITQINISDPQKTEKNSLEKSNVIVRYEKYTNDEGKERRRAIRRDVSAKVKIFSLHANAKITGSYSILDVKTSKIIQTKAMSGEYNYNHKWGEFSGDERALSSDSLQKVKNDPGVSPSGGDRVNLAAKDLVSSLSSKIISYTR